MKYFIYIITNPVDNAVIYVGATKNVEKRMIDYKYAGRISTIKVRRYFQYLWAQGITPVFTVIEECTNEDVVAKEIDWIKHYAKLGKLLNTAHVREFRHSVYRGPINPNLSRGTRLP